MSAAVEAAWIGAGIGVAGTVIVAVSGHLTTVRNTARTLDAARADRIWDKKAIAYAETAGFLKFQIDSRHFKMRIVHLNPEAEQRLAGEFEDDRPERWRETWGRLAICASLDVQAAFQESLEADSRARYSYVRWSDLVRTSDDSKAIAAARWVLDDALDKAGQRDQQVIDRMYYDLARRPSRPSRPPIRKRRPGRRRMPWHWRRDAKQAADPGTGTGG